LDEKEIAIRVTCGRWLDYSCAIQNVPSDICYPDTDELRETRCQIDDKPIRRCGRYVTLKNVVLHLVDNILQGHVDLIDFDAKHLINGFSKIAGSLLRVGNIHLPTVEKAVATDGKHYNIDRDDAANEVLSETTGCTEQIVGCHVEMVSGTCPWHCVVNAPNGAYLDVESTGGTGAEKAWKVDDGCGFITCELTLCYATIASCSDFLFGPLARQSLHDTDQASLSILTQLTSFEPQ
jgi:hypothetical protein